MRAAGGWAIAGTVLALLAGVRAQEPGAPPDSVLATFSAELHRIDLQNRVLVAVGHVQIRWEGGSLRCHEAVVFGVGDAEEEDAPGGPGRIRLREVYVAGDVLLTRGDRVLHLEAARGFLDVVEWRGLFFDSVLATRAPSRDEEVKITVRAEEIRQLAKNRFEALDLTVTTNPFAEPGYLVASPFARIQIDPRAPKPGGRPGETVRNVRYEVDSSVFYLGELPLFVTPRIAGNTAAEVGFSWLKRFGVDNSGKFGPSVFLSVGTDITIDERKWGELLVNTQYLGDRGPGIGVDLRYQGEDHRGYLTTFYQNDEGEDELFGDPPNNDRGRVTWRHRQQLPEHIQLDLEFSKITDRGYLAEYFEDEFKSGKEQETLLYLKRALENRALTLLASTRLNGFQDQVEHQPQLGYNLFSEPLFDIAPGATLYFDADYEVTRARRRFDDATGINDRDAVRVDLDNRVGLPFFAGPIKLQPFAGFRYTHYSNGRLAEHSFDRVGTLFGVQATTQLSRTWTDVSGGPFDLEGLRHIITPEVEYLNVSHVSHDVADFIQFDAIDALTEREVVRVGVRNRLQTIWQIDGEPVVVDLVDLDVEWPFFIHADRDNRGETLGNLDVDLYFRPTPELTFLLDFEYSFVLDGYEVLNATVGYAPSKRFQLGFGYRRYAGVNDAVFIQTQVRVSERLQLSSFSGFDFEEGDFLDQRFVIQRIGVDWVFELEINFDNSGDFGVGLAVTPRGLFDPRLKARSLRHEPRFAGFGEGLIR